MQRHADRDAASCSRPGTARPTIASGAAITDPSRFHVRVGNARPAGDPSGYVGVAQVLAASRLRSRPAANDVTLLRLAAPVAAPTVDLLPPAKAGRARAATRRTDRRLGLIRQIPMRDARADAVRRQDPPDDRRARAPANGAATSTARRCSAPGRSAPARRRRAAATRAARCSSSTPPIAARYQAGSHVVRRRGLHGRRPACSPGSGQLVDPLLRGPAAGLGAPPRSAPSRSAAADDTAPRCTATVTPRGADVFGLRASTARATSTPRDPCGSAARRPGRSRSRSRASRRAGRAACALVAWSSYGVRHSAPVRVTTTDTTRADGPAPPCEGRARTAGPAAVPPGGGLAAGRGARRGAAPARTRDRARRVAAPVPQHLAPARRTSSRSGSRPACARPAGACRLYDRAGHRSVTSLRARSR